MPTLAELPLGRKGSRERERGERREERGERRERDTHRQTDKWGTVGEKPMEEKAIVAWME